MHATPIAVALRAVFALALLLSATATIAAEQAPSLTPPTVQSADFIVSERGGLISLRAVRIDLARVLSELSRVSGISIEILDEAGARELITVSFHEKTINSAVAEVMAALPPGGIASVTAANGAKPAIHVLTKEGADNFRSDVLAMIASLEAETPPAPAALRAWLLHVATIGFKVDPAGTSTTIVPVLRLLDKNYATYEPLIASFFRDSSITSPLRSAMLELIERHWNFPTSRNHLLTVFNQASDDRVLHALIARALIRRGENVADEVIARYRSDPPEARAHYAEALAMTGRSDALPFLREDTMFGRGSPLRCASISAVIQLDPASTDTLDVVDKVIHAAKPVEASARSASDLDNERLAMRAVVAIGQSADPAAGRKLLSIAKDESVAIDVRLTALESLAPSAAMPAPAKTALHNEMALFERQVTDSADLSEVSRERVLGRIRMLQKLTASE